MGRLTDSLNEAIEELDAIESGVERMNALGQEMLENTAEVAQSALKFGYMAGQREAQAVADSGEIAATPAKFLPAPPDIEALQAELKKLRKSQSAFQTANDAYRIQQTLVLEYLKQVEVSPEIIEQVKQINQHRSIRKAPAFAEGLLDLDRSQIFKLLKKVALYSKHLLE